MRDPKRVRPIMLALESAWNKHPDWRLGQLIENLAIHAKPVPIFYIEDDAWKQILEDELRK